MRVKSWSPLGQGADGPEQTAYTYGPGEPTLPRNILHNIQDLGADGNQNYALRGTDVLVAPYLSCFGELL